MLSAAHGEGLHAPAIWRLQCDMVGLRLEADLRCGRLLFIERRTCARRRVALAAAQAKEGKGGKASKKVENHVCCLPSVSSSDVWCPVLAQTSTLSCKSHSSQHHARLLWYRPLQLAFE